MMKTWHRLVPTYGNWGGPHWGGGSRFDFYMEVDWECEAIDALDAAYKIHDIDYRDGALPRREADAKLVLTLLETSVKGWYANAHRIGAIVFFGARSLGTKAVGVVY